MLNYKPKELNIVSLLKSNFEYSKSLFKYILFTFICNY